MIIALCLNSRAIEAIAPDDYEAFEKWPGSGWIGALRGLCFSRGIECLSGEIVLDWVNYGKVNASDVVVIQEESASSGEALRVLGAKAGLIFCLESPLYTSPFYAKKDRIIPLFNNSLCFGTEDKVHFPSYCDLDLKYVKPWDERRMYSWVVSNKFVPTDDPNSLHPYRDKLLTHFMHHGLQMAGQGWNPNREVKNKREFISDYKFNFAIENYVMPGYVTEKLIHALVAGCLPVYVGAPDAREYVPEELFFQVDPAMPLTELQEFLESIDKNQANQMIEEGQSWLSDQSNQFRYENFSRMVFNKACEDLHSMGQ